MTATILFALGGLMGSALRVVITTDQETFSRKSVVDLIVGALIGIIYPLYPLFPLPEGADLIQKSALIAVISYAGGDLVQSVMSRVGTGIKAGP